MTSDLYLFSFIAFISVIGGLYVHEYSGRFLSPRPVFTSMIDTTDPQSLPMTTEYISTFSIDGQWYLLWSGIGSGFSQPGTNARLLMPSWVAGKLEESAVTFASVTFSPAISTLASKKNE